MAGTIASGSVACNTINLSETQATSTLPFSLTCNLAEEFMYAFAAVNASEMGAFMSARADTAIGILRQQVRAGAQLSWSSLLLASGGTGSAFLGVTAVSIEGCTMNVNGTRVFDTFPGDPSYDFNVYLPIQFGEPIPVASYMMLDTAGTTGLCGLSFSGVYSEANSTARIEGASIMVVPEASGFLGFGVALALLMCKRTVC